MAGLPHAFEAERKLDYGRPLMRLGSEDKFCDELRNDTDLIEEVSGEADRFIQNVSGKAGEYKYCTI